MSICLYRLSRAEYDRAVAAGVFEVDAMLDRIDEDLHAMTPKRSPHTIGTRIRADCLRRLLGPESYPRIQQLLAADDHSEPEPDLAVVPVAMRDYRGAHPMSAVLAVGAPNESLHHDLTLKQYLYARCGILEYWLLDLPTVRIEAYCSLATDRYRCVTTHANGNVVSPPVRPDAQIVVMLVCWLTYSSPRKLSLGRRKLRIT